MAMVNVNVLDSTKDQPLVDVEVREGSLRSSVVDAQIGNPDNTSVVVKTADGRTVDDLDTPVQEGDIFVVAPENLKAA